MLFLCAPPGQAAERAENPEEIDIDADGDDEDEDGGAEEEAAASKDDFEPDVQIGQKAIPAAVFGSVGEEAMGAMERLKKRKTG